VGIVAEPTTEVRRYVTVLQAREGYPPQDAPMADQMQSPAPPEIVSVVKTDDYEDLRQQMEARDERVLDLEAEIERLKAADEGIAADRDEARAMVRAFVDLYRDDAGDVIATAGVSEADDLVIAAMKMLEGGKAHAG
jgi:hypothetical protein